MPASKRLVVDASIARSAGAGKRENPFSSPSRAALNAIEGHHEVVFSEECFEEWRRHEKDFARRWRRRMVGGKRVIFLTEIIDESLRESLAGSVEFISEKRAVLKDAHLVEAALQLTASSSRGTRPSESSSASAVPRSTKSAVSSGPIPRSRLRRLFLGLRAEPGWSRRGGWASWYDDRTVGFPLQGGGGVGWLCSRR
jgi:hypothetical protein